MLDAIQGDFDFVYDAIKYHQFIHDVIKKSELKITKLPETSNVDPKTLVNLFASYGDNWNPKESLQLACLISQRFPNADKTKKLIEYIRLI
jgi:hypothetical protein